MNEVIIATKNQGKASEFIQMFASYGMQVKTLLDYPDFPDIEETGKTFEENAALKAETLAKAAGRPVIADDSGLSVDALDGRPGVYSARYAGEEKSDNANIDKLLQELEGVPLEQRNAHFYCALAVAVPGQQTKMVAGKCEGRILEERRGEKGFGYDPVFYVDAFQKTMAELEPEVKNSISHRGEALKVLKGQLPALLGGERR